MAADYRRALEVAIPAAQAAGELLRREFHRAGGPRGTPGKAPVDTEAEWLIRKLLLEATPGWWYRGEETGEQAGAPGEPHCWLVDPNDGTWAYQRGYRGAAVSIALLRDGCPVLGVVYAFAAPDDAGDLVAWAEGCGPVRRNGQPVARQPWPAALDRYDIVLVSQAAERRPSAYAVAVAPARFLGQPSIAYRLALAAAGEASAVVVPGRRDPPPLGWLPQGWDYAAGHALLRAVGGELVDDRGRPVTYSRSGDSQSLSCFGGGAQVVAELARRNWRQVYSSPIEPAEKYDLIGPEPGQHVADAGLLSRAQGCLLGQLAGDALGSAAEFQTAGAIARRYPGGLRHLADGGYWDTIAGQPTDDSELALMLARSIVQAGRYDPEAAAQAYSFWFRSAPFDCGRTIGWALGAITDAHIAAGEAAAAARKAANPESQANGSLMRLSPLGIWGHALSPEELARYARADSELTHRHPVCQDAAAVYAIAIAYAVASGSRAQDVYDHALAWAKQHVQEPSVCQAVADARSGPPNYLKLMGWALIALQNALYQLLHASSFEEGLVETVMSGGDTDTNAAIAGALLGAVHGRSAVPAEWRQLVLSCRPIPGLANVERPRPRAFWPVDALHLAERLLLHDNLSHKWHPATFR